MIFVKKCWHKDIAVKCRHKDWIFIIDKKKAVRRCTYNGVCVFEEGGGGIKNGEGEGGERLLHR